MQHEATTSESYATVEIGPLGACRLLLRGIPVLSAGSDGLWPRTCTPWFPLTFFVATAIVYSFVSTRTYYGYWVLPGRLFPNFILNELFIMALAALAIQSFMFVVQFAVTVFVLSCAGLDDASAKSSATRALYIAAILHVFSAPFLPLVDASVGAAPLSAGLQTVAWCALIFIGALRAGIVAFGVARSNQCSMSLGIVCALFGPESWLLLGRVIGPMIVPIGFLCLFAAPGLLWYRERKPYPDGFCQTCGYDLTGNVSGRCPECGTAIAEEDRRPR